MEPDTGGGGGDGATVEAAAADQSAESVHPPTLEPQTPWIISQMVQFTGEAISTFGWPLLLLGVVCALLWSKYSHVVHAWRAKREEDQQAAIYHKNPDLLLQREAALESARLRMQERYAEASRIHAEKQRQREEEKRLEKLANWEAQERGEGGRRLRATEQPAAPVAATTERRKPKFRPEYNPLLGAGGSGYRPSRPRGAAGGG